MNWNNTESAIYLLLSGLVIMECMLTLYINIMDFKVRERGPTAFANSLALAIGLVSFISTVFNIIIIVSASSVIYSERAWCFLQRICLRYLHSVSSLSVTCLALDRYVAICWPLHYASLLTPRRCNMLAASCWMGGFLILIAPTLSAFETVCQTLLPFLIAYSILYLLSTIAALTFYVLVHLEFKRPVSTQVTNYSAEERRLQSKTKMSTLLMAFLYTLLSLPQIVLQLINEALTSESFISPIWLRVFGVIHRFHFLLFLPLYAWNNTIFRQALTSLARRISSRVTSRIPQIDNSSTQEFSVSRSRSDLLE